VSDELRKGIESSPLTGASFADVDVSVEEQFAELQPDVARRLPRFWWLAVSGRPGQDDFGLLENADLVVSDRALTMLRQHGITNAIVRPHESQ
jgi:hypothetical protein